MTSIKTGVNWVPGIYCLRVIYCLGSVARNIVPLERGKHQEVSGEHQAQGPKVFCCSPVTYLDTRRSTKTSVVLCLFRLGSQQVPFSIVFCILYCICSTVYIALRRNAKAFAKVDRNR